MHHDKRSAVHSGDPLSITSPMTTKHPMVCRHHSAASFCNSLSQRQGGTSNQPKTLFQKQCHTLSGECSNTSGHSTAGSLVQVATWLPDTPSAIGTLSLQHVRRSALLSTCTCASAPYSSWMPSHKILLLVNPNTQPLVIVTLTPDSKCQP